MEAITAPSPRSWVLNVEARLEQNYWVLSVIVHQDLGLQVIDDENALLGVPLTLEEFANALHAASRASVMCGWKRQPSRRKRISIAGGVA